jgi:hypothetical protein
MKSVLIVVAMLMSMSAFAEQVKCKVIDHIRQTVIGQPIITVANGRYAADSFEKYIGTGADISVTIFKKNGEYELNVDIDQDNYNVNASGFSRTLPIKLRLNGDVDKAREFTVGCNRIDRD